MKRILALCLCLCMLCSLMACASNPYPPVESTEQERTEICKLTYGGKQYAVPYELYRTLCLTYRTEVDGGDIEAWNGPFAEQMRATLNERIFDRITEIYAVLALAEEVGINPYDKATENEIAAYVRASVEGGYVGGINAEGFGTYEKYLESLAESYMNYSVQALIYRYYITSRRLDEYFIGKTDEYGVIVSDGALTYTDADVQAFYRGEESVRLLWAYFPENVWSAGRVEAIRDTIALKKTAEDVAYYMTRYTTAAGPDVESGHVIGRYSLDPAFYGELTKSAFALAMGETAPVIRVVSDEENGYYILYRTDKSEENLAENFEKVEMAYAQNEIGKKLVNVQNTLLSSKQTTEFFDSINPYSVKMP